MMLSAIPVLLGALGLSLFVRAEEFTNPLKSTGPDPFIVWDKATAAYYFMTTTATGLRITTANTLNGLKTAEPILAYQNDDMKTQKSTWAPELHKVDGRWYIYYTFDSHPWVISGGENPLDPFSNPIKMHYDYGIDGTVLNVANTPYFLWSCLRRMPNSDEDHQSICISKLKTPTEIDIPNTGVISQPTAEWERHNSPVNEGAQPLYWNNEIYVTFSGSHCTSASYSLGLLHLTGKDPLKSSSWTKTVGPVFSPANGEYGTGHNGIFISPDGKELWNVFHAMTNSAGSCGDDRSTFAQKVDTSQFETKGPIFGQVQKPGPSIRGPSGEGPQEVHTEEMPSSTTASATTPVETTPAQPPSTTDLITIQTSPPTPITDKAPVLIATTAADADAVTGPEPHNEFNQGSKKAACKGKQ